MAIPSLTAISLSLAALLFAASAAAAPAATVTHLSGVLATSGAGESRVLCIGSKVEVGETLSTASKTYARLKFDDGGEITLRPESEFRIESFHYDAKKPEKDSAIFRLLKGGLRTITGLVGKRDRTSYKVHTVIATIGIRGTSYRLMLCDGKNCAGAPPGLYTSVTEGGISLSNASGEPLDVFQGQNAYVAADDTPPVLLVAPPLLPRFEPPASFRQPANAPSTNGLPGEERCCQVR